MPRPANPFVQISKRIASLQAKSTKINDELNALASLVAAEALKQEAAAAAEPKPAPVKAAVAKAPAAKKPQAKASVAASGKAPKATTIASDPAAAPKKRGRPSKK